MLIGNLFNLTQKDKYYSRKLCCVSFLLIQKMFHSKLNIINLYIMYRKCRDGFFSYAGFLEPTYTVVTPKSLRPKSLRFAGFLRNSQKLRLKYSSIFGKSFDFWQKFRFFAKSFDFWQSF